MKNNENMSASINGDRELGIEKFKQISGINKRIAEALYDNGIHNYVELIDYLEVHSAEDLIKILREQGISRKPGSINKELWINQARILSKSANSALTWSQPASKSQKERKSRPTIPAPEVRQPASVFTVSFDILEDDSGKAVSFTKVYNENNGGEEKVFAAADTSGWVNWILERAHLPPETGMDLSQDLATGGQGTSNLPTISQSGRDDLHEFHIEICDFQVSTARPSPKTSEAKVKVVMGIRLLDTEGLKQRGISFRTEIYTLEMDSGYPRMVSTRDDQFKDHILNYSQQFEFAMPEVGRYEFHSIVRLLPSGELKAYQQGPIVRVTP
jgi:hypothetical protein